MIGRLSEPEVAINSYTEPKLSNEGQGPINAVLESKLAGLPKKPGFLPIL